MATDKTRTPATKRPTGDAAFEEVIKGVAERNEAAFKAARKLREVADAKKFAERRKRDLV
jgi:hypothetical protein